MLPTSSANDVIQSISQSFEKEPDPRNIKAFMETVYRKNEEINYLYKHIAVNKNIPTKEKCQKIRDLTRFMSKKHYTFFKKHNAIDPNVKPDYRIISTAKTVKNSNYNYWNNKENKRWRTGYYIFVTNPFLFIAGCIACHYKSGYVANPSLTDFGIDAFTIITGTISVVMMPLLWIESGRKMRASFLMRPRALPKIMAKKEFLLSEKKNNHA